MRLRLSIYFLCFLSAFTHISCAQVANSVKPLKENINNNNKTNVTKYLNEKKWNELFPHRYGIGAKDTLNNNPDFYSFKTFVNAAKLFPTFLSEGSDSTQKREMAAFLANIAQETSGGWENAPGGYFKWGLYYLEETGESKSSYNDTSKRNLSGSRGQVLLWQRPKATKLELQLWTV